MSAFNKLKNYLESKGNSANSTGATTAQNAYAVGISTSTGTFDSINNGGISQLFLSSTYFGTSDNNYIPTGSRRINVSSTTTVYLVGTAYYSTLGGATWGTGSILQARRVR